MAFIFSQASPRKRERAEDPESALDQLETDSEAELPEEEDAIELGCVNGIAFDCVRV